MELTDITPMSTSDNSGKGKHLLTQVLLMILSTTISLVLTLGTMKLVELKHQKEDRRLSAMMVMSSIETRARGLEKLSDNLARTDSVGAWLLAQPKERLELLPEEQLLPLIQEVTTLRLTSHDESAEKIFSSSLDTWKNMGNFQFIDNVGACFSAVNSAEQYWNSWVKEVDEASKDIFSHPEQYEGGNIAIKHIFNEEMRYKIARLHNFRGWLKYAAEVLRHTNRENMAYIGISEQEVMEFTDKCEEKIELTEQEPNAMDYYTPELDSASLTSFAPLTACLDSLMKVQTKKP